MKPLSLIIVSFLVAFSSASTPDGWIDEQRLLKGEANNWLSLGGNYKQQHYSPLNRINADNVQTLGFAWEYVARSPIGRVPRGLEAIPFVVDGRMYTSGAWGFVYCLDAKTGREIWKYDPKVDASYNRRACCDVVNRGVAVWKGKVYVGTLDGYMVCLNANDGSVEWRVDTITDRTISYTITGAPQVAGDVVVIGNSGAEFGVRGYITAYDLESGDQKWRFFTVPGDPKNGFEHPELEMASKTWDPNSDWETGGGGTVWGQYAYDPELNLLYVGTGNSSPYPIWFRSPSGGDNLFLVSILAINPDTGRLAWHYQTTPGEIWDYTATQNLVLAELKIGGRERKVIMQAPKNGFFYVLDRATGELLSAEKYTELNWASHIDMDTGRPVKTEQGWYKDEPKFVIPAFPGGHSWQPMSYSPDTGLVYIPEIIWGAEFKSLDEHEFEKLTWTTGLDYSECCKTEERNKLKAWDPIAQAMVWEVENEVAGGNGGILTTNGGLAIQGTNTGYLKFYRAETGELLHSIHVGTGIMAAPMSFVIDGDQYIAVMAGYGGSLLSWSPTDARIASRNYQNYGRILAFKLGGGETPLPPQATPVAVPPPIEFAVIDSLVAKGKAVFEKYCMWCHHDGSDEERFSHYPNLAKLNEPTHLVFKEIVLDGLYSANGMASFADALSEEDVEAVQHYLVSQHKQLYAAEKQD